MASDNTTTISADNFVSEVLASDQPVLVDFHADWCQPCRTQSPTIDDLATEFSGRVKVGAVDVDAESALAQDYDIRSIPTVLLFKGGKVVGKYVGLVPRDELADALEQLAA